MKIFKFLAVALVAMLGFTACDKDCDHDFIEYDNTKNLVGTWTYLEEGQAEAMVIKADGSFEVTGVMNGGNGALYEEKGTIKVVNNKVTLAFDGDKDVIEGRLELVACKSLSIVLNEEYDIRLNYNYCKEDLSDEIVGMWVCNDGPQNIENDIIIRTYDKNGKVTTTGIYAGGDNTNPIMGSEANYKVVGDLVFKEFPKNISDITGITHSAERLIYTPKAIASGDIMTFLFYMPVGDKDVESRSSYLRIKQHLELPGMKYDYIKTFVTNVKGEDKDIPFLNTSFNFAKMDGSIIDKFLKATLFAVEFPDANTLKYNFLLGGEISPMTAPIEVEDNKMTIKMSVTNPAYQDVVVYAFQDQDNTQMHLYMPTSSFEKFFANASVHMMLSNGQLNENDTEAIANEFKKIADAIESINLSIVMSQSK